MNTPSMSESSLSFHVNGKRVCVKNPDPKTLLGDFLREEMGLKGLQMPCKQGGCGACTVLISFDAAAHANVCSCLMPLCSVDGMHLTTIEGVGSLKTGLSSVQQAIVDHNGTQCGFCTPGMIMSMHGLMFDKSQPTAQEIEDQIDGNLCRCTGYRPIFNAFHSPSCAGSQFICHINKTNSCRSHAMDIEDISRSLPIRLMISEEDVVWVRALVLKDVYDILRTNSGKRKVRLVRGNTSTGIYPRVDDDVLVDISRIPSLLGSSVSNKGITIGGAVTISDLMLLLKKHSNLSKSYTPMFDHLKCVATPQVRNVGSVAGNLMVAHQHGDFVSDVATILIAAESRLTVCSACLNTSEVTISLEEFFRMTMENKVITQIFIPSLPANSHFITKKVALRRVNSHPIVNAAFKIQVDPETGLILPGPIIVYGGIRPYPQRAQKTENELVGKSNMDQKVFGECLSKLQKELVVDPSFRQTKYRALLINHFFYCFLLSTYPKDAIPHYHLSGFTQIPRPISSGTESYGLGDPSEYPVSLPLPKLSSPSQATGEAEYLDDLKFSSLHAAYVLSSVSNAIIAEIDPSKAFEVKGVMSFLSADTISASGYCNFISDYETVFASQRVQYHGQAVGLVVATTKDIAIAAAEMVIVKYKDLTEPILTIEDAIRNNSFFDTRGINFMKGNVGRSLGVADVIVEGEVHVGHQYHFHLETHRALCIPGEEGCMVVYSSTQNPSLVQQCVSVALNCPQHKITVNVKRVGGAYGAKLNRTPPVAMACAMAADMLQKPVRLVLDLPTNMQLVGGRSPYLCRYKVGAENNGRITAIEMHIFNNQGSHFDFEYPNLGNLPMFIDGVYSIENWEIEGKVVKTNLPACTYMRGPVFVETAVMIETILEHVAHEVLLEADVVRDLNMYDKGDITICGQHLADSNAKDVFHHLRESSEYIKRRAEVKAFNEQNKWVKRGISLIPVKFGAFWEGQQMLSLVNIHTDASISIYQSGIEMGQGLDVKIAQVITLQVGQNRTTFSP
eukprot:TRINITY_DN880_c1_g2_i1.p1 TRINITY_DN880_c1_g2~~TRINITY_DN880_c1_g2_i1.p1  ORF type:complete len:1016 (-),score=186.62 TRINITY_DN880_c1_g2_i1:301-3348(-)